MADYNKQTVAQLRQLLKDRSIPSTGLTRKAQIIEKLEVADKSSDDAPTTDSNGDAPEAVADAPTAEAQDDAPSDPVAQVQQDLAGDEAATNAEVSGPALAEAGGMSILEDPTIHEANG